MTRMMWIQPQANYDEDNEDGKSSLGLILVTKTYVYASSLGLILAPPNIAPVASKWLSI